MQWYLNLVSRIADSIGIVPRSDLDNIALGVTSTSLLIAIILTIILIIALYRKIRGSKNNTLIRVNSGTMLVSNTALREFIAHIIKQVSEVELQKVVISSAGRKVKLKIYVVITVNCNLVELSNHICEVVNDQLASSFGLAMRSQVKVIIKKMDMANSIVFCSSAEAHKVESKDAVNDSEFCYNESSEK